MVAKSGTMSFHDHHESANVRMMWHIVEDDIPVVLVAMLSSREI